MGLGFLKPMLLPLEKFNGLSKGKDVSEKVRNLNKSWRKLWKLVKRIKVKEFSLLEYIEYYSFSTQFWSGDLYICPYYSMYTEREKQFVLSVYLWQGKVPLSLIVLPILSILLHILFVKGGGASASKNPDPYYLFSIFVSHPYALDQCVFLNTTYPVLLGHKFDLKFAYNVTSFLQPKLVIKL